MKMQRGQMVRLRSTYEGQGVLFASRLTGRIAGDKTQTGSMDLVHFGIITGVRVCCGTQEIRVRCQELGIEGWSWAETFYVTSEIPE